MAEIAFNVAATILVKLGSSAYQELGLAASMKKELKKLKDKTLNLQSVLGDAEKKQTNNEPLKNWLVRVKDVFNDAVDVLDEFECEMLRRQVVKEYGGFGKKVSRFFSRSNPIAFRLSMAHKVKEIRERLDEIVGDMAQFQLISAQLNVVNEPSQLSDRMTHSYVNASEVIGRDDDKDAIVALLLREDGDLLSVIPIIGFGGLGKTMLAKSVYNDAKVVGEFDLRLWVCVSLDFDVNHLLRQILREIKIEEDVGKMSIEQLQTSLRSNLEGNRVLLVLDDVWNEDRSEWLKLRDLLVFSAKGSKVIVTARSTSVSSIMTRTPPHELEGLSEADSLSLFNTYAFGDEIEAERHPNLRVIGTAIAKKCGGVPLVLKTLGCVLYSKPEAEWVRFRDQKIWELEREDARILAALRLSYNTMSPSLKQCFACCSIFPDDTVFQPIQLVSIWMALGIFHSPNQDMELEDIGELQFQELLARSFMQYENAETREIAADVPVFHMLANHKMHDLIHDLACSVTDSECLIVKSDRDIVMSDRARHLRIDLDENNLTFEWSSKKLQSLYIYRNSKCDTTESILSECITRLRYLRVFDLEESSFEVLPSSVGTLKHLRYLNLSECKHIKRLPETICDLQSLQTLLLNECDKLEELPRGIRKLISLRTLSVTTKQMYFPENGIGRLKCLRTLSISKCGNLRCLPKDIKYCTSLRSLFLSDCDKLELGGKSEEAIVELSLQTLYIRGLPEMKGFPHWLKGASKTLKLLYLETCDNLVELPEWLSTFTFLNTLTILECGELVALPDGFQELRSLEHLRILACNLLNLESEIGVVHLSLKSLVISELPKTTALPQWLQGANRTLKTLHIKDCPMLASLPEWLAEFTSLEKFSIDHCPALSSLPKGMSCLTSLTTLGIEDCRQLELASESSDVVRLSLQCFRISRLPKTTALPEWLQGANRTLKTLVIEDCPMLTSLPEWLAVFTSLELLVIEDCQELSSLPKGMSCLTDLVVESPSVAFYERYAPEIGTDWEAISHIPNIYIFEPPSNEEHMQSTV